MSYTDAQLQAFWYGGTAENPGTETNILPGAFVLMGVDEVSYLTNKNGPGFDANFAALNDFCYTNKLFGWANYLDPNKRFNNFPPNPSAGWNGPTKS
jgi:hypothetical protein